MKSIMSPTTIAPVMTLTIVVVLASALAALIFVWE